ncbi:hypothetical protein [Carboxydothermus hydrogenoformans]|uniref:Alkaline protease domain protein n=1 Tax=Carboxydothermus hydrogenoformans (strain ATCC BAA-161 / DSM 6008 / Z-2901) TaxID=246194 RepID=Q3AAX5_CARHZ|nr:hypothetical protein [Carboxydothermus hydrogenoformans]ABB14073.1 alkaline protease domain protein [Carboxydothermus hydrogenoformans Z-2901]
MKKRILVILLLTIFLILILFASVSFADQNPMSVELGTRDLTAEQIKQLKKDPDRLTKRAKMDVIYLLSQADKEMNAAEAYNTGNTVSAMSANTVYLGSDATFYVADMGNKGHSTFGIAGASERYSSYTIDSHTWTTGLGSASSWAYIGKTIYVSGAGSKGAYIRFKGSYSGSTVPGFLGGIAGAEVKVTVYDVTAGSQIGSSTILLVNDSIGIGSQFTNVPINLSIYVVLQAGHTYCLRYHLSTSVSNYSPQMVISDFWDDTNSGIYMDKVTVDFI